MKIRRFDEFFMLDFFFHKKNFFREIYIEYIEKGEWAVYTIDVEDDGLYDIDIFYSSTSNSGKISFEIK